MGSFALEEGYGRNVPQELPHPLVSPKKGHVTMPIIPCRHESTLHSGHHTTLKEIREYAYWIVKVRSAVASYIWKCGTCRKLRGPLAGQKIADLPAEHLDRSPPSISSYVDLFSPFCVEERRSERKRWRYLFTCFITGAFRIEVVPSLQHSFLHAYRHFLG